MENFTYSAPTRYVFGRDAELQAGQQALMSDMKRVLVVFGHESARKSGLLDRVEKSLSDAGVFFMELGGIDPNPTDPKVREGIAICRANNLDGLVAVGGGSVIDTAKAIAAGVPYDGDFWDFWAGKATIRTALPVGVVLTIPAAGSEGSGNSVITLLGGNRKISLRTDFALRPKWSLLNPVLTFTLPPYQTASGIADMMAHIMERYFTNSTGVQTTDRISEGLLKAIIEEAPKVMADPDDYDARANIMWAGTLAHNGICGTGRVEDWSSHALEHEISALYGVTHGAGLAVIFPAWMTFMSRRHPEKIAQFARRVFGVMSHDDSTAAMEGIMSLKAFFGSLGLPVTFPALGVPKPDIDRLVENLHKNKGPKLGSYLPLGPEETAQIYRLAL